jgi:hypothetical protein
MTSPTAAPDELLLLVEVLEVVCFAAAVFLAAKGSLLRQLLPRETDALAGPTRTVVEA